MTGKEEAFEKEFLSDVAVMCGKIDPEGVNTPPVSSSSQCGSC